MSQGFCFQAVLDNDRHAIVQDLPFATYKNFIKTLMDSNYVTINHCIDEIIKSCIVKSNFKTDTLSCFDKALLLLIIKSYSIAAEVKFKITCEETDKQFDYTVNLNEVIILLLQLQLKTEYTINYNNLKIIFRMPSQFNEYSRSEALTNWIHSVEYNGKQEAVTDKIIEKLPINIIKDFETFISHENEKLINSPVITYKSPFADSQKHLHLSLFDNSLISFIRLLFETDLLDLYETEYFLMKEHNFNQDIFNSRSPAEIEAYISIIQKHIQEKESNNQSPVPGAEIFTGDSIDNIE